jgi:hypothetical protein
MDDILRDDLKWFSDELIHGSVPSIPPTIHVDWRHARVMVTRQRHRHVFTFLVKINRLLNTVAPLHPNVFVDLQHYARCSKRSLVMREHCTSGHACLLIARIRSGA